MPIPSSADIQGTSDLLTVTYLPPGSSYVTLDTIYPEECSLEESCRDQDLWCQRFFKKVRQTHTGVNPFLTVNIWDFERSTALTSNFFCSNSSHEGQRELFTWKEQYHVCASEGSCCFATRSAPQKRWKGFTIFSGCLGVVLQILPVQCKVPCGTSDARHSKSANSTSPIWFCIIVITIMGLLIQYTSTSVYIYIVHDLIQKSGARGRGVSTSSQF